MDNTIRVERAKKRITQGDLAEKIGVSRQTIHAIETNKFTPSTLLALKIARYFSVTVEDIFILEDSDLA
ncbi:MAG: helix-turn-helix transcriptional regulator [Bacteroidales bacterium]|nr:helix-turn-helix transcriptional regulator [Bacteroidales bacterium]